VYTRIEDERLDAVGIAPKSRVGVYYTKRVE
jgi:hypothetical protein